MAVAPGTFPIGERAPWTRKWAIQPTKTPHRPGPEETSPMPRPVRTGPTVVKVRQIYARYGKSYCAVGIPTGVMAALGWQPGMLVLAYPTKDGCLKMKPVVGYLSEADADYDSTSAPAPEELKGPKPGSPYAKEVELEAEYEAMIAKLGGRGGDDLHVEERAKLAVQRESHEKWLEAEEKEHLEWKRGRAKELKKGEVGK